MYEESYPLDWQASLLGDGEPTFDERFTGLVRHELAQGAWVDEVRGWVTGADNLFGQLLTSTPWRQRDIWMYERRVPEPRLTHRWRLDEEDPPLPLLRTMAATLGEHYSVAFTQVGTNLYRDGNDSVAWHGDRIARELPEATVAVLSLGAPRPFKLRPKGGGASIGFLPGPGDLLVMGGSCQRTWDHTVPKVSSAAPRMSVQFRHAYDR
ncbi:MAG: alpha-ketoglutarate-dependent dioxygenase AlkB [Jiangellaceae bacterium]